MSPFAVCSLAVLGVGAGLCVALLERFRSVFRYRHAVPRKTSQGEASALQEPSCTNRRQPSTNSRSVNESSNSAKAVAYQNLLDDVAAELDRDIAEWEALLEDFPRVPEPGGRRDEQTVLRAEVTSRKAAEPSEREFHFQKRTRPISPSEHSMIVRLSNTGFAPEEIALWLNLPLERIYETLNRR